MSFPRVLRVEGAQPSMRPWSVIEVYTRPRVAQRPPLTEGTPWPGSVGLRRGAVSSGRAAWRRYGQQSQHSCGREPRAARHLRVKGCAAVPGLGSHGGGDWRGRTGLLGLAGEEILPMRLQEVTQVQWLTHATWPPLQPEAASVPTETHPQDLQDPLQGAGCAGAAGRLLPQSGGLVVPQCAQRGAGHLCVPVERLHQPGGCRVGCACARGPPQLPAVLSIPTGIQGASV